MRRSVAVAALLVLWAVSSLAVEDHNDLFGTPLSRPFMHSPPPPTHPPYDHQTVPYDMHIQPFRASNTEASVTPFFSPDDSVGMLVELIQSAESFIHVTTPGFSSWSGCTPFIVNSSQCLGCSVEKVRYEEQFPVYRALLNALHKGVAVFIVTNDYEEPVCDGLITPLDLLKVAGAKVRYYTSTTFNHLKFVSVDGKKASVSSVNFSFTSFMKNREAGMKIEDNAAAVKFLDSVFEEDFDKGYDLVPQKYSAKDMETINDKTMLSVEIPPNKKFSCKTASPTPKKISSKMDLTLYASPDYSFETLISLLRTAHSTLDIEIYQVTDERLCSEILSLSQRGIAVRLLVSQNVFDPSDWKAAETCYNMLVQNNSKVFVTRKDCLTYSHQKFWIVDGETVGMSSGNWSPTDYPGGSSTFPSFKDDPTNWRKANRDITIHATNPDVVKVFQDVFDNDFEQARKWYYGWTDSNSE